MLLTGIENNQATSEAEWGKYTCVVAHWLKKLGTGAGEEETQEPWSATCHRHPDDGPEEEKGLVLFKFKMKEVGSTERILSERVRGLLT